MAVQDDARERELRQLFNLREEPGRKRGDEDAFLVLDGRDIHFELKSTTTKSISTVRDFGPDHIAKWRDKHWIFGFYDKSGRELRYCHYASPSQMAPWIQRMERYVRPDVILAEHAPALVTSEMVTEILGDSEQYSLEDAQSVMKKQWNADRYRAEMDAPDGYSKDKMLELLRLRCAYVLRRGATLNNPHIPAKYFEGWERITESHAGRLRELVARALAAENRLTQEALASADATEEATE